MKTHDLNPTSLIYRAAGSPKMPGDTPGHCRVCGKFGLGLLFDAWVRSTFTDLDKLFPGEIMCHACLFCFDERNAVLAEKTGKKCPQRMRNYSHFVVGGEWYPLTKANKSEMRKLLIRNPTIAIVALSGQKHIIFRARRGWWQIEEHSSPPFPELLAYLLEQVESLYQCGASKKEIIHGHYSQKTVLAIGLDRWRELESKIKP